MLSIGFFVKGQTSFFLSLSFFLFSWSPCKLPNNGPKQKHILIEITLTCHFFMWVHQCVCSKVTSSCSALLTEIWLESFFFAANQISFHPLAKARSIKSGLTSILPNTSLSSWRAKIYDRLLSWCGFEVHDHHIPKQPQSQDPATTFFRNVFFRIMTLKSLESQS